MNTLISIVRVAWIVMVASFLVTSPIQAVNETTATYQPKRTAEGKPDFNGVWQVLNTANNNLEAHGAQAAMAMREGPVVPVPAKEVVALGAVGAIPASLGVVEGSTIPYQDWALEKRDENRNDWLSSDPEIKCYLPGIPRATYMPHPFQIVQEERQIPWRNEHFGGRQPYRLNLWAGPIQDLRLLGHQLGGGSSRFAQAKIDHLAGHPDQAPQRGSVPAIKNKNTMRYRFVHITRGVLNEEPLARRTDDHPTGGNLFSPQRRQEPMPQTLVNDTRVKRCI